MPSTTTKTEILTACGAVWRVSARHAPVPPIGIPSIGIIGIMGWLPGVLIVVILEE